MLREMDKRKNMMKVLMRLVLRYLAKLEACHIYLTTSQLSDYYIANVLAHKLPSKVIKNYNFYSMMSHGGGGADPFTIRKLAITASYFLLFVRVDRPTNFIVICDGDLVCGPETKYEQKIVS